MARSSAWTSLPARIKAKVVKSEGAGPQKGNSLRERLNSHALTIKTELFALGLAYRDARTPWYARLLTIIVVAYAFSPIDLIPDFIPVFGYLDDLLLVPIGIGLAIRMIPADVMREARERAGREAGQTKPPGWLGVVLILGVWVLILAGLLILIFHKK
jgi:uncharacterized membrane protein YkvA (DUF1232 family)